MKRTAAGQKKFLKIVFIWFLGFCRCSVMLQRLFNLLKTNAFKNTFKKDCTLFGYKGNQAILSQHSNTTVGRFATRSLTKGGLAF